MLTPQEAESHVFPKASFGGYNMLQVDNFLDSHDRGLPHLVPGEYLSEKQDEGLWWIRLRNTVPQRTRCG